jgi:hypothetical protein
MSLGAAWPARATISLVLLAAAAACSGWRSLMAWAHTAAWGPEADEVVGVAADEVVVGAAAGVDDEFVVFDFDELPQAATATRAIEVNSSARLRFSTSPLSPNWCAAV